ncbi:hypothetical protein [Roseovarius ramblicola]|uniref:IclR-ED domain-containing protein n=1 Tax=Roseovarius ramblicola TaxID=2022336 RepID=A0ABV5I2N2_9RHOB
MYRQTYGEIAALEYHGPPGMEFPDIVEEFDIASHGLATQVRRLTWDGDDLALIDRECVRIALGWLPPERKDRPHYLVIAIGPPPRRKGRVTGFDPAAYGLLLERALDRVGRYMPFDALLRGPASQTIGAALLDRTFDLLGATAPRLRPGDIETGRRKRAEARDGGWQRDAVEPGTLPAIPSQPMRLTVVTLGLTLFLHAPPVGAALLTYTALREAQPLISG